MNELEKYEEIQRTKKGVALWIKIFFPSAVLSFFVGLITGTFFFTCLSFIFLIPTAIALYLGNEMLDKEG